MTLFRKTETDLIQVPAKVANRAKRALAMSIEPSIWVDQNLYLIGHNVTHHKRGDPLLDEAVTAAESLLALLVEMRRAEQ